MANNLWVGAVTADLAANRPTTPDPAEGTFVFFLATDTQELSIGWNGAWANPTFAGATFGSVSLDPSTYANRPAQPAKGDLAFITDANSGTPGASISAGSGTNEVVACYSGAAWVVVALIKSNA